MKAIIVATALWMGLASGELLAQEKREAVRLKTTWVEVPWKRIKN